MTPKDADAFSVRSRAEISGRDTRDAVREICQMWETSGMTWFRVTIEDDYLWIECWKERPEQEAAFYPRLRAA